MTANPYISYQKKQVETADRGTLLLLLYEGALRFMKEAKGKMEEEDYSGAFAALSRADRIVKELIASLDLEKGGDIAQNLFRLYEFVLWKLFLAEKDKKVSHLDEAMHIIEELKVAWKDAFEKEKEEERKVEPKGKIKEGEASISVVG